MSEYKLKTGKLTEKATSAYKKIEDTVVDSYKKVEDTVVGSYKKVEDAFVDTFLEKADDDENASAPDAVTDDESDAEGEK